MSDLIIHEEKTNYLGMDTAITRVTCIQQKPSMRNGSSERFCDFIRFSTWIPKIILKYAISASFRYFPIHYLSTQLKQLVKLRKKNVLPCKYWRVKINHILFLPNFQYTSSPHNVRIRNITGSTTRTHVSLILPPPTWSLLLQRTARWLTSSFSLWFPYQWNRDGYKPIRGWFLLQGLLLILFLREISLTSSGILRPRTFQFLCKGRGNKYNEELLNVSVVILGFSRCQMRMSETAVNRFKL